MRTRRAHELRPRKSPSQARSRDTVAAILTGATRVFAAHGYAGGTTNRIAEEAGVSVGSLYEYFPNKDAIVAALMERHVADGHRILADVGGAAIARPRSLHEDVTRFVQAMIDFHAHDRAAHRVLFEEAPLPPHVRRQLGEVERQITAFTAVYLRNHPDVRVRDHDLAATVVVQTIEGLTHKMIVHADADADVPRMARELVTLVTAYLTTPH